MIFTYTSTHHGLMGKKKLPEDVVEEVREYLEKLGIGKGIHMSKGELNDLLVAFRTKDGDRLLINQLEPIFVFLCVTGCSLWKPVGQSCSTGS